ncbi:MAG: tetratricopeptide repeat protein [Candidatus Kapabacteria bacterium]|nr:tetratricopeptide repeat protein [Ignavibacteriota bacterium]MCW5884168.1 tetratricopeptide repeat protein [Candidatus Kapabacteria bacterium]
MKRVIILMITLIAGAILFQSFQCSSRNITTAKVKMKSAQYDEAIESLNKELAVNPNSDEAYALLADIYYQRKDKRLAAKNAKKALELTKNPQVIEQEKRLIYNLWIDCYNSGMNYYSLYLQNNNPAVLDSAIDNFKIGIELRPEFLEFYNLKGIVYELKKDTDAAIATYEEYVRQFDRNYQFGKNNGLYSKVLRDFAVDKLGKPKFTKPGRNSKGDSTITDLFEINGKELYLFSESEGGRMKVMGWNYDLPSSWLPDERQIRTDVNTSPIAILAQHYYTKQDLEKSLKYIKMITDMEPENTNAYSSMVGIYQELGKTDEAVKTIQDLIKSEPTNPLYITQLADLYHNLNRYDESIETYKKALSIDAAFDRANRNLASAFKNRASQKQKGEQDKRDIDKNYKIDTEVYLPDLRESAKYFAKSLESKTFANDMMILSELANIYQVLDDKDNLKKIVRNLEAIEMLIDTDKKEQYYLNMYRIYSEMGEAKKAEEAGKKAQEAGK